MATILPDSAPHPSPTLQGFMLGAPQLFWAVFSILALSLLLSAVWLGSKLAHHARRALMRSGVASPLRATKPSPSAFLSRVVARATGSLSCLRRRPPAAGVLAGRGVEAEAQGTAPTSNAWTKGHVTMGAEDERVHRMQLVPWVLYVPDEPLTPHEDLGAVGTELAGCVTVASLGIAFPEPVYLTDAPVPAAATSFQVHDHSTHPSVRRARRPADGTHVLDTITEERSTPDLATDAPRARASLSPSGASSDALDDAHESILLSCSPDDAWFADASADLALSSTVVSACLAALPAPWPMPPSNIHIHGPIPTAPTSCAPEPPSRSSTRSSTPGDTPGDDDCATLKRRKTRPVLGAIARTVARRRADAASSSEKGPGRGSAKRAALRGKENAPPAGR